MLVPTRMRCLIRAVLAPLLLPSAVWPFQVDALPSVETVEHALPVDPADAPTEPTVRVRDLGAVEGRTAAFLLSGQSGGDLPGAVLWCAEQRTDEEGRVPLFLYVELDGMALFDCARPDRVPLEIASFAIDGQGAVIGSLVYGVVVEGEGLRAALVPGGLRFVGKMALPPGMVSVRTMARVHGTERFLLSREELRLTTADKGEAVVSAPLFAASQGAWLEARQEGLAVTAGCVRGFSPVAKPVLDVTRPMRFVTIASGWPDGARLRASILDRSGRAVEQPQLSISSRRPFDSNTEIIEVEMLPFDVPQGEYRVTLRVVSDTSGVLASRGLDAQLVPGDASSSRDRSGKHHEGEQDPVRATDVPGDPPGGQQLESAYLAALRVLSVGDRVAAQREVAGLERRVFDADRAWGPATLQEAELNVAERLGRSIPNSLAPLIVLHRNLCHTYATYRETVLARHSAVVVDELARMIEKNAGDLPVDDVAELSLISVALDLVLGADLEAGEGLLERALELNPESIPALLNLAALRERTGIRSEAVDLLRTIVGIDPGNQEAQLRLGVNLRRTGAVDASQEVLRALVGETTPDWIRSIAAQELAHLMVDSGRLDEAEHLLVGVIDGIADRQSLAIQLAWIRDLAGRPGEATATLAQVERNLGRSGDSARLRYAWWPDMIAFGIGDVLIRGAEEGRPDLRRALGSEKPR